MMTNEDAVAWCAAREVSVIFRPNGNLPASVVLLLHGSAIKAEKPTLPEAVEEASRRLVRHIHVEREVAEARRRAEATQKVTPPPSVRIP